MADVETAGVALEHQQLRLDLEHSLEQGLAQGRIGIARHEPGDDLTQMQRNRVAVAKPDDQPAQELLPWEAAPGVETDEPLDCEGVLAVAMVEADAPEGRLVEDGEAEQRLLLGAAPIGQSLLCGHIGRLGHVGSVCRHREGQPSLKRRIAGEASRTVARPVQQKARAACVAVGLHQATDEQGLGDLTERADGAPGIPMLDEALDIARSRGIAEGIAALALGDEGVNIATAEALSEPTDIPETQRQELGQQKRGLVLRTVSKDASESFCAAAELPVRDPAREQETSAIPHVAEEPEKTAKGRDDPMFAELGLVDGVEEEQPLPIRVESSQRRQASGATRSSSMSQSARSATGSRHTKRLLRRQSASSNANSLVLPMPASPRTTVTACGCSTS